MALKIAFLTGCLERGKDGVGDFTQDLAASLEKRGMTTMVISLCEPELNQAKASERAVRIPRSLPLGERFNLVESHLGKFSPGIVSWQFVPYAYHPRGFVQELQPFVKKLKQWNWDLFFHELWLGDERNSRLKEKIVGYLQKSRLMHFVSELKPNSYQTTNFAYAWRMNKVGWKSAVTPLDGSIPINGNASRSEFISILQKETQLLPALEDALVCTLFGSLHPVWPAEPLLTRLKQAASGMGKQLILLSVGSLGPCKELWNHLAARYPDIRFIKLGFRSMAEISCVLQQSDFGLATTPYLLLGKSASVAAMLDHGLPVIVNREDYQLRGYSAPPFWAEDRLVRLNPDFTSKIRTLKRKPPTSNSPQTVQAFLTNLKMDSAWIGLS
ncbi:MAG: hypothetical protein SFY81_16145 [Verrucomicrobiota bacterium]|nr:hypothetical protein [Verrucomicrobiota bacterium]